MRRSVCYIALSLCIFLGVSFAAIPVPATAQIRNPLTCITNFDRTVDYFPDKADSLHAELFDIDYHKSFKVVFNNVHNEAYVLYQCGTPRPGTQGIELPEDIPTDAKFLEIPLGNGMALSDTTIITFIELLGLRSKAMYVSPYLSSPCFKKLVEQNKVMLWPLWPNPEPTNYTYEFAWGKNANDVKHIAAGSLTAEVDALGRAEWIEFISTFFNYEAVANLRFDNIIGRYHCHTNAVKALPQQPKKKVAWLSKDTWTYRPIPAFIISSTPFVLELLDNAGADTMPGLTKRVFYNGTDPVSNTTYNELDQLYQVLKQVDIVINAGHTVDPTLQKFINTFNLASVEDYMTVFPFLANSQVYQLDGIQGGSGNDWWESSLPEPDVILEDLIEIVRPDYQQHKRVWLRNIATGEQQFYTNSTQCWDVAKPLLLRADCCNNQYCPLDITVQVIPFTATGSDQSAASHTVSSLLASSLLLAGLFLFFSF